MFRILPERPDDTYEVEYLFDLAFAPGRTALSSYRLRDGIEPLADLSSIARDEYDTLAGAIRYWPIRIGDKGLPALLLGPIAVHPTHQGEGLGALLIAESLDIATRQGWERVVLIGDQPYYGRFGFSKAALEVPPPTNPDRILARALVPGGMDGVSGIVRKWQRSETDLTEEPRVR